MKHSAARRPWPLGRKTGTLLLAGIAWSFLWHSGTGAAEEETRIVRTSGPESPAALLSAPHVGASLCDVADRTPVLFLRSARHGPHTYAEVKVLDGDCEGQQGYLPSQVLHPADLAD